MCGAIMMGGIEVFASNYHIYIFVGADYKYRGYKLISLKIKKLK